MRQEIKMFVSMVEETDDCMLVTVHKGEETRVHIHGSNCPVTLELTPNQEFDLLVELKSSMKDVPLT